MVIWATFQETEAEAIRPLEPWLWKSHRITVLHFVGQSKTTRPAETEQVGEKETLPLNSYTFGSPQFTTGISASANSSRCGVEG